MEEESLVRAISSHLYNAKGWIKFLGVLLIIYGIITAISIVGLLICWLPIWMGILLFKTSTALEKAQVSGDRLELINSLSNIKTYFTINGVLALIGIIFIAFSFLFMGSTMNSMMNNF